MSRSTQAGVIAMVCLCLLPEAWGGRQDFTFRSQRCFAASSAATVTVNNWAGRVRITGDQTDSIRVVQDIVIPAADSAWAETFLEEVETSFDYTANQLTINARILKSKRERPFMGGPMGLHDPGRGEVHYELRVPPGCRLAIVTHDGSIHVESTAGDVHCHSRSGSLHLANLQGRVAAHSNTGSVTLADCAARTIKLGTESGAIEVTRVVGAVSLATLSGRISAHDIEANCLITTTSASIEITELHGRLTVRTYSGDVRADLSGACALRTGSGDLYLKLRPAPGSKSDIQAATGAIRLQLPATTGVDLEVKTSSGGLFDDLGIFWQHRTRREHSGRMAGGGALVQLETASGDIHLGGTP